MVELRRTHVPNDDLDMQAYLREYINAKVADGDAPALYFERMEMIEEKLAEADIAMSDQEANIHVFGMPFVELCAR